MKSEEEKNAIMNVVDSGYYTMGSNVKEFEKEFARVNESNFVTFLGVISNLKDQHVKTRRREEEEDKNIQKIKASTQYHCTQFIVNSWQ